MQMNGKHLRAALCAAALIASAPARASLFSGDTLDFVADILAWVVLIAAPIIAVTVFWLVHILPERIAEQRHHPQAAAIKTLCLLSLVFGGLLWPIAWLWAYSKPVLYKMAYGVDIVKHGEGEAHEAAAATPDVEEPVQPVPDVEAVVITPIPPGTTLR
jgi:CBS domain containing-hemolysin-like protein